MRDVFATLFSSSIPYEEKPEGLLDDDTGVAAALEVARDGVYADAVATAEYTIEDFVFTSPTEAWFRYAIDTGTSYFGQRYGTAHPDRRLVADLAWGDLPGPGTRRCTVRARPRADLPAVVVRHVRRASGDRGVHGDRGRRCRL